ncbi:21541_t:CDS:2, partial [Gigaspora margarita]
MRVYTIPYYTIETLAPKELNQLDSETPSNDEDDTEEEFASSSTNTQAQGSKKPHPPVKCKYCPKKFKCGLATRMQKYTNNCTNVPESAKTVKKPNLQDSNLMQGTIENYIDRMDHNEILNLDYKFTKAVYASGLPLSTFKNPFWIEFFHALQPSFQIP